MPCQRITCFFYYLVVIFLFSCSSGKTRLDTVNYYSVSNGDNVNYYRIRIDNKSKLSKVKYKSGWYPTRAVDRLFGSVTSNEAIKYLEIQEIIRKQYDKRIIEVNELWLKAAGNPATSTDSLKKIMKARKRILAYPYSTDPFEDAFEVEYNPEKGLAIHHSDEKFVIAISANPNEVMDNISAFAESDQTSLQIKNISNVIRRQNENEIKIIEAKYQANKSNDSTVLAFQIDKILRLTDQTDISTSRLLNEIGALKILINNSNE